MNTFIKCENMVRSVEDMNIYIALPEKCGNLFIRGGLFIRAGTLRCHFNISKSFYWIA